MQVASRREGFAQQALIRRRFLEGSNKIRLANPPPAVRHAVQPLEEREKEEDEGMRGENPFTAPPPLRLTDSPEKQES